MSLRGEGLLAWSSWVLIPLSCPHVWVRAAGSIPAPEVPVPGGNFLEMKGGIAACDKEGTSEQVPGGGQLLQKLTVRLGCSAAPGVIRTPHSPVCSAPAPSSPSGSFAVNLLPWRAAVPRTGRCWGELGEPGPGSAAAASSGATGGRPCARAASRGSEVAELLVLSGFWMPSSHLKN